ncbi:MAG: AAA family ATPase, partial [Pirellulaceae bacterium]
TTLMQFIRSMLFGFSSDRLEKYVPPVYGGLAGGSAFVKSSQGNFEIQRHVDPNRHADAQGDLTLIDNKKGDVHGNATLGSLLANIDESIFNNVFAVGLREIQELGSLNNTQAADHLYRLTSGLDRVSLVDVMRDLQKRRDGLWSNDSKAESAIVKLQTRRQHLLKEIEEQRQKSKRWSRIAAQAKEATKRLEDLQAELKQVEREARLVELSIQLSDRWQSRELISQQIEAFGNLPDPREVSVSTLDQLNQKIIKQKERANQIRSERKHLIAERDKLGIHSGIWDLRTKVEALQAHTPWIESLERQAQQYREEIERIESSVDGEIEGLGSQVKLKNRDLNDLANRGISSLKAVAVNLTERQKKLTRLKDEADKVKFELGQNEKQLGDSLAETTGSIPESLEDTSRNVNRLRRRLELDEKIDKLQKSRSELEMEIDNVVEDQVLPVGKLAVIGLVFITGFILVGFGVLSSGALPNWNATFSQIGGLSQDVGIVMIIMGLVCGFIALGVKYHWERVARDSMDDFRHQIEMVRNQLKRARAERDEIDRLLPPGTNQVELDLQDAESRLTRLEGLVPLENRAKTSRVRFEEIRRMITAQEREVEECEKRWQSSLRAMGLPDSLTPQQVREISVRSSRIADYASRLELCRSEMATREKELAQVSLRVGEMLATAGIKSDATLKSPLLALQRLNNLINEQRQLINTKKELRVTYTTLRSNLEKARREYDRLLGQRLKLLSSVGVETEEDYRQFDVKHAERSKLVEKRKQLTEQIAAALGKGMTEDDVRPLLSSYGKSGLEKRWEQLESDIDRLKSEQASLLQQRGERLQEIKALGEDSRLDMAR